MGGKWLHIRNDDRVNGMSGQHRGREQGGTVAGEERYGKEDEMR